MPYYISSLRSRTHAEKAKRALERAGVRSSVVSLDRALTSRGCAFGIKYSAADADTVRRVLDRLSLSYGDVLGR